MAVNIDKSFLENLEDLISQKDDNTLLTLLSEEHPADIAEIFSELDIDDATYILKLLDSDLTSDALLEIEEDKREKILKNLSEQEIAEEIGEMDTDDAADIISELSDERASKVISEIEDDEHASDIVDLLKYEEGTAGALMAKELVKVKENWLVPTCVRKMRTQAQEVTRVHSIYVVDKEDRLIGRLSLKDLLVASADSRISDIYIPKVDYVNVHDKGEDVALLMQKYDLEAIPVVDDDHMLLGRITIDDIVDLIREEAEKDYQMAAGITEDIDADDSILDKTKARLPWLVLGLVGGFAAASIMGGFEDALVKFPELFYFTPLIAAMAGNVGVQSSAIVVQGLATNSIRGSMVGRMVKEIGLSVVNGVILALLIFLLGTIFRYETNISITISISLIIVIIIASLIGTFVPLILDKNGIDPAVATGPFITTSNDIFGIFIFFFVAKLILGF
jgi:magnesium transporter